MGDHGQLELFTLLLFGVQWFCSPFPVERCSEMEFVQTCSSTSHLNVSFVYVGVHALNRLLPFPRLDPLTVRYKLLGSTIAQKLILLNQQTREFIAPSRSCVVCVDRLHHARDNQDQQRLDQEEEKNGEAKNDDREKRRRNQFAKSFNSDLEVPVHFRNGVPRVSRCLFLGARLIPSQEQKVKQTLVVVTLLQPNVERSAKTD
ncbi:hypothetical protein DAPPUDRAFT_237470 [Daphnia pulex]|uniref:Secreted protein n=1 Tax=Daphnia pulex TaxID=6669 RepID=E9G3Y2_DAPPU|nr:hypothetical protein DAPPUDRAFT_237470 [Daphnia pulex]|eukprot:EFX85908.1 hypothetical protein DAPPUDRAFT_237470 [Daphnia pulex]